MRPLSVRTRYQARWKYRFRYTKGWDSISIHIKHPLEADLASVSYHRKLSDSGSAEAPELNTKLCFPQGRDHSVAE